MHVNVNTVSMCVCRAVSLRVVEWLSRIKPTLVLSQNVDKAPLSCHFPPFARPARSAHSEVKLKP